MLTPPSGKPTGSRKQTSSGSGTNLDRAPAHRRPSTSSSTCGARRSRLVGDALRGRGHQVDVLPGGWRAYRRWVCAGLFALGGHYDYRVLCGPSCSGQERFLQALTEAGEQVVDLRALACHARMLDDSQPSVAQPTQRQFDSDLVDVLRRLDPERPVWIEAVGQRLGAVSLPRGLVQAMLRSQPIFMDAPIAERIQGWKAEQPDIAVDPLGFIGRLSRLESVVGRDEFAEWRRLAGEARVSDLLERILVKHIDPSYERSTLKNFAPVAQRGVTVQVCSLSREELRSVASGAFETR